MNFQDVWLVMPPTAKTRATARAEKDWAVADEVRDRLAAAGIEVVDTADGVSWKLQ